MCQSWVMQRLLFTAFYSNLPFKTGGMKKVNMSIGVIVEALRHGHTKRWLTRLEWARRRFLSQLMHY